MPNLNPQTVATNWANRLGAATDKIRQGVQSVTTSPTQLAAASVGTWQARMADPAVAAKFQNSLQRVSLSDWQNATLNKGLNRIASGAQAAIPKMQSFMSQFLPYVQTVQAQVRSMPNVTLQDRINRMVQNATLLSQFKRTS